MNHYPSHMYSASLAGKFLIASPYCMLNNIFDKSLIYLASHSAEGAIGLIVNHLINKSPVSVLLGSEKVLSHNSQDLSLPVYLGGPVDTERGFILHSAEYTKNVLLKLSNSVYMSSNKEILSDLLDGAGPINKLFIMGYTAWTPGQLEQELLSNFWLVGDFDEKLLYNIPTSQKWSMALSRLGIDAAYFSSLVGRG